MKRMKYFNDECGETEESKKKRSKRGHDQVYCAVQLTKAYRREMDRDSIYETLLRTLDNQGALTLVEYCLGEEFYVSVWGPFKNDN